MLANCCKIYTKAVRSRGITIFFARAMEVSKHDVTCCVKVWI